MLRIAAILMLGALALPADAAPVYKCTKADGSTYYSGQPCPETATSETLRVQKPATNAEGESGKQEPAGKTLDERIAEAEDPVVRAQLELRKKQCELARTQLERYEDAPYLVEKMEDGSQRRLSDEEAAAEKQKLREMLQGECR